MKRCPRCGTEYTDDYGFCSKCGIGLQEMVVSGNNTKTNKGLIVIIVILSVLL